MFGNNSEFELYIYVHWMLLPRWNGCLVTSVKLVAMEVKVFDAMVTVIVFLVAVETWMLRGQVVASAKTNV